MSERRLFSRRSGTWCKGVIVGSISRVKRDFAASQNNESEFAFEKKSSMVVNMLNEPIVKSSDSIPADVVGAGTGTKRQVLISDQDAPNFALRRFIMEPSGGMPKHTNSVEHEQYILRGKARVGIGDTVFGVKAGDAVFIPEGVPHWYEADAQEGFEFLCIVPNKEDVIELCDSAACK
ncbi:MAG: cupin domain-containing protein [Opitutales bacterium]